MKRQYLQSVLLQIIYKGFFRWFLKLVIGVKFPDTKFLTKEKQFILLSNHNSHLDTLSLLASLPGSMLRKVKPVAAEDYFGNTRLKARLSNYFINTLLISRKVERNESGSIEKILNALDEGYSLIFFPEGTRGQAEKMEKIKPGIARVLSLRPDIKYIPVYLTGMGKSLPKGELLFVPYKSSVNFGEPTSVKSVDRKEIMKQLTSDFQKMQETFDQTPPEDEES